MGKDRIIKAWGVEYTIMLGNNWSKKWVGPCGIFGSSIIKYLPWNYVEGFMGRPILFRTRKLARAEAKRCTKNTVKYRVIPCEFLIRKVVKNERRR